MGYAPPPKVVCSYRARYIYCLGPPVSVTIALGRRPSTLRGFAGLAQEQTRFRVWREWDYPLARDASDIGPPRSENKGLRSPSEPSIWLRFERGVLRRRSAGKGAEELWSYSIRATGR